MFDQESLVAELQMLRQELAMKNAAYEALRAQRADVLEIRELRTKLALAQRQIAGLEARQHGAAEALDAAAKVLREGFEFASEDVQGQLSLEK